MGVRLRNRLCEDGRVPGPDWALVSTATARTVGFRALNSVACRLGHSGAREPVPGPVRIRLRFEPALASDLWLVVMCRWHLERG